MLSLYIEIVGPLKINIKSSSLRVLRIIYIIDINISINNIQ